MLIGQGRVGGSKKEGKRGAFLHGGEAVALHLTVVEDVASRGGERGGAHINIEANGEGRELKAPG